MPKKLALSFTKYTFIIILVFSASGTPSFLRTPIAEASTNLAPVSIATTPSVSQTVASTFTGTVSLIGDAVKDSTASVFSGITNFFSSLFRPAPTAPVAVPQFIPHATSSQTVARPAPSTPPKLASTNTLIVRGPPQTINQYITTTTSGAITQAQLNAQLLGLRTTLEQEINLPARPVTFGGVYNGPDNSTINNLQNQLTTVSTSVSNPSSVIIAGTGLTWNGNTLNATAGTLTGTLGVANGGTGITSPSAAGVLLGDYAGTGYQQIATSSLGLVTTNVAEGSNLYFTNPRAVSALTGQNISIFTNNAGFITSSGAPVQSVFGRAGSVTAQTGDYTTSQVPEGTNFYYTPARGAALIAGTTTDALLQGVTNKYYSDTLARGAISSSATGLTYTSTSGVFSLTSGYNIPLTASTTAWNAFTANPSSVITAGTGLSWTGNTLNGNTGTVTSVGLSLPNIFNVSGSPVTTSGSLSATLVSQSQNLFFASPNGSSGSPSFRALVAADVPTLNQNTTGTASNVTGTVAVANGGTGSTTLSGILIGNATNPVNTLSVGSGLTLTGTSLTANAGSSFVNPGTLGFAAYYNGTGSIVSATSTLFFSQQGILGIGSTTPSQNFGLNIGTSTLLHGGLTQDTTATSTFSGDISLRNLKLNGDVIQLTNGNFIDTSNGFTINNAGSAVFRALSAIAWNDNQSSSFFQIGPGSGNKYGVIQAALGNPLSRFMINSNGTTITDQAYNNVVAPVGLLNVIGNSASKVDLIVKGAASQSTDIFQVLDNGGNVLQNVASGGNVGIATTTPSLNYGLDIGTSTLIHGPLYSDSTTATSTFLGGLTTPGLTVQNSNASVLVYNPIPTTGVTNLTITAGAGQSNSDLFDIATGGATRVSFNPNNYTFTVGSWNVAGNSGTVTMGIGSDLRANSYGAFTITNPTLQWPNASPDVNITRISSGMLGIGNGTAGNGTGTLIAGKIGVGTMSPYSKLSVYGSDTSANTRLFELTNSASTTLLFADDAGNINIPVTTSTTTVSGGFSAGGSSGLTVQSSSGYVGIGTSSPSATFSVTGNGYITGGIGVGLVNTTSGTLKTQSNLFVGNQLGTDATSLTSYIHMGGATGVYIQSPLTSAGQFARGFFGTGIYWDQAAGDWQIDNGFGQYAGMIMPNNSGELSFINENAGSQGTRTVAQVLSARKLTLLANGRVGVGTAAPGAVFEVSSTSPSTTDLFRVTGSSNALTVTSGGNVGIATTTPPSKLTVVGSACISQGGNTTVACSTTAGTITANVFNTAAADLAESYPTSDATIAAGDVVMADASDANPVTIAKATKGASIIGVISTQPGVLLGDTGDTSPNGTKLAIRAVALAGRVPVRVSMENGPIKKGDYLTISSTPGVAMEATNSGDVIGTALESASVSGTITIFVRPGYANISADELNTTSTPTVADQSTLLATFGDFISGVRNWASSEVSAVTGYFKNLMAENFTAKKATIQTLCVGNVCVTQDQLKALLDNAHLNSTATPSVTSSSQTIEPSASSSTLSDDTTAASTSPDISTTTPDQSSTPTTPTTTPDVITPDASSTPATVEITVPVSSPDSAGSSSQTASTTGQ